MLFQQDFGKRSLTPVLSSVAFVGELFVISSAFISSEVVSVLFKDGDTTFIIGGILFEACTTFDTFDNSTLASLPFRQAGVDLPDSYFIDPVSVEAENAEPRTSFCFRKLHLGVL